MDIAILFIQATFLMSKARLDLRSQLVANELLHRCQAHISTIQYRTLLYLIIFNRFLEEPTDAAWS